MKSQLTASVLRLVWLKNFLYESFAVVFTKKSLLIFIVINWWLRCANWTNKTDLYCKCVIREFKVLMLQHESSWNECMYIFLHLFSLWGHFIHQWRWKACGKLDPSIVLICPFSHVAHKRRLLLNCEVAANAEHAEGRTDYSHMATIRHHTDFLLGSWQVKDSLMVDSTHYDICILTSITMTAVHVPNQVMCASLTWQWGCGFEQPIIAPLFSKI